MARVPTYTNQRELPAGPNQMPSVRMTAAVTAQDLNAQRRVPNEDANRDLSSAARSFSDAISTIELRRDQAQVMVVESEAKKAFAQKQLEWKQRTGINADGLTGEATKWIDEEMAKYEGQLSNPRQKNAFAKIANNLRLQTAVGVSEHEATENRKATVEAARSTIALSAELAAQNPSSPLALEGARNDIIARTALIARTSGLGKEEHAVLELSHLSTLHDGVVSALITGKNTAGARTYFDEKSKAGELNESTRARLAKVFEASDKAEKAQAFADRVIDVEGLTENEATKKAQTELKGDEEKDAIAEITTRFARQRAASQREQAVADDEGWAQFNRGGTFSSIDPAVVARMDPKSVRAIKAEQLSRANAQSNLAWTTEQRAASRANRSHVEAERARTEEQRNLAAKGGDLSVDILDRSVSDPKWFASIDLRKEKANMTDTQYQQLASHQRAVRAEIQKAPKDSDATKLDIVTSGQQVKDVVTKLGIKDKAEAAQFELTVNDAIYREQVTTGKKLDQAGRQKIIDRYVVESITDKGMLWDSTKRAYEVKPEEAHKAARQQGVPDAMVQQISAALTRANMPVTSESILKYYDKVKPK